jgi:hypothetical protein
MNTIPKMIDPMFGQSCCRKRVSEWKRISLGFGQEVYHNKPKMVDSFYGEWEIGSYFSAWRIVQNEKIICGSNDAVESIEELDIAVKRIDFGRILSLKMSSSGIDIRAEFDTGVALEFLSTRSGDDESFQMFLPENICVTFGVSSGWLMGKSNKPSKLVRESEWDRNG